MPAVAPGVETRIHALVKQIKASANYNEAIGEALGIEGAVQAGPDLTTIQLDIKAAISGSRVEITWGWAGNSAFLDMLELEVDRGDGKGFTFLANDTTPGYIDTMPFPATPTQMDLPRHLSGRRPARRPMEQTGQRDGGRLEDVNQNVARALPTSHAKSLDLKNDGWERPQPIGCARADESLSIWARSEILPECSHPRRR